MTKIGDSARVTRVGNQRGEDLTGFDIPAAAWRLWQTAKRTAASRGSTPTYPNREDGGTLGFRFDGSLGHLMRLQTEDEGNDFRSANEKEQYKRAVFAYLRATRNAVCAVTGPPPVWWIRQEWNEDPSVTPAEPTPRQRAEQKVTPQEAGEDRQPGEVTTRQAPPERRRRRSRDERAEMLLQALVDVNRPVTFTQAGVLAGPEFVNTNRDAQGKRDTAGEAARVAFATLQEAGLAVKVKVKGQKLERIAAADSAGNAPSKPFDLRPRAIARRATETVIVRHPHGSHTDPPLAAQDPTFHEVHPEPVVGPPPPAAQAGMDVAIAALVAQRDELDRRIDVITAQYMAIEERQRALAAERTKITSAIETLRGLR